MQIMDEMKNCVYRAMLVWLPEHSQTLHAHLCKFVESSVAQQEFYWIVLILSTLFSYQIQDTQYDESAFAMHDRRTLQHALYGLHNYTITHRTLIINYLLQSFQAVFTP